jgi:hypothetical protein
MMTKVLKNKSMGVKREDKMLDKSAFEDVRNLEDKGEERDATKHHWRDVLNQRLEKEIAAVSIGPEAFLWRYVSPIGQTRSCPCPGRYRRKALTRVVRRRGGDPENRTTPDDGLAVASGDFAGLGDSFSSSFHTPSSILSRESGGPEADRAKAQRS